MKDVMLVARRELALQLRSKGFSISVLATVVIVAAMVCVPQLLDRDESFRVGLVGEASHALDEPLTALAAQSGTGLRTARPDDEAAARAALSDGDLDAVVIDRRVVLGDGKPDQRLSGLIQSANEAVAFSERLSALDLSDEEILRTLTVTPLQERSIASGDRYADTRQGIALLIMLSLLFLFMTTTVGVAAGVVEEKGSRIVEILLVALKPWQLLTGKLLAFGVLGVIQLAAFAVTGIVSAYAVDLTDDLPPGMGQIVAATFLAYLLGFLFFGAMAAALGSLVSRQEETNGSLAPMTAAVVLSYVAAYIAVSEPDLPISSVITVLPPISMIALPVQLAAGNATMWQVVVGFALMIAAIVAIVALAGRIYERSVLRIGGRVKITEAIRGQA
jgi:ABC-2 type transport system permease protein